MIDLKTFQGYIRDRSSLMSSREEVYAMPGDDENFAMIIRVADAVLHILWTGKNEKKWR
jgi:hypothetical protein